MTYRTESLVDDGVVAFEPGTSLLVTGPARLSGRRVSGLPAEGLAAGERAILITADASAERAHSRLRASGESGAETRTAGRLGIVDCSTGRPGPDTVDGVPVGRLGSPGDLTGISLEFAKLHKRFSEASDDRLRVGLASVSTVLMYAQPRTVFRFLHVFTSRIRSGGMFGAFSLAPSMHDEQTVNTIRAVFDAEASVDRNGTGLSGSGFARE